MTGGFLQLAAYGVQDTYLSGKPQITFFTAVYKRYTNFSIQTISQYFHGDTDFGKKVYCQIDRIGDLLYQVFLRLKLPSLKEYSYIDDNENLVEYYWVNSVGHSIIKIIDIEIGGVVIDRQYGLWMEIWTELIVPFNKKNGFYDMIGKSDNPINFENQNELDLYIPFQFWFCKNIGSALPLVSIQSQEVRFNITFRKYEELIISSTGAIFKQNNQLKIIQTHLDVDYIFLEEEERKMFVKNDHKYLIQQLQVYATSLSSNSLKENVQLNFNHPVKELFWVIQNKSVLSTYPYGGNEWFNFSTQSYKNGKINGSDTMIRGQLTFEGNELFDMREAKYFRTIVPYKHHTNIPNNFIYMYSFSNNPEEFQPSGSCNFSRIDNQILYLEVSDELIEPMITVFAVNYNILNISNGMTGIEYSN
jgi:hypothetical protein